VKVEPFEQCKERRVGLIDVDVGVNGIELMEFL
jgi:hypothetical protein